MSWGLQQRADNIIGRSLPIDADTLGFSDALAFDNVPGVELEVTRRQDPR